MAAAELLNESSFDPTPFDQYLAVEREKDLLRFLTCGSVDDGKSTLIGRLLYDSRNVFEDQVNAAAKATRNRTGGGLDLSLLTDGLRAEREQGITIDVAYRYFATARRKFIIADTPGHEQYTRNMATGASTAGLAILLIDARLGVLDQTRRHAYICSLLGIPSYVVAINKMDLVDYDPEVFENIRREFSETLARVGIEDAYFIPMSALAGDNVVTRSTKMPWFEGPSLLEHLEAVEIRGDRGLTGFRMAVQRVARPDHTFRGFAGSIAAGSIHPGDVITALPSGLESRVKRIATFDGDLKEAIAPMAVTLELEDHLDISRGDLLYAGSVRPHSARRFEARLVWMDARPLEPGRRYLLKHTSQTVPAEVSIRYRIDIHTLAHDTVPALEMNAIGEVEITTPKPVYFDPYQSNRSTGSFILIDPETNATSGAGMIRGVVEEGAEEKDAGAVTNLERTARWGHRGAVIRVAASEIAHAAERALFDRGCAVAVVSGEAAARVLEGAGILALLIAHDAPSTDVKTILHDLELDGILRPRGRITRGGGI